MKRTNYLKYFSAIIFLFTIFWGQNTIFSQNSVGAGTEISNFALASYKNDQGDLFNTTSPLVKFTVRAISSLYVTPDETEPSTVIGANDTIVRQFKVCNTSNITDSYILTQANVNSPSQVIALYYDIDNNGEISAGDIPVSLNNTKSPSVAIGSCINVLAQVDTKNISVGSRLNLSITARSTIPDAVNGFAEKAGTIINTTGKSATFTDPNDPTLVPSKLIEEKSLYVTAKDQQLHYVIAFRNSGEVAARNVVITDELPSELAYTANSLRIDGRSATDADDTDEASIVGKTLLVKLANPVAPNQIVRVTFQAIVSNSLTPGKGIVNTAKVSGANASTVETTQAVAVIDPFGTVYAARGGASAPINGARVAISTDKDTESLLGIPQNQGFDPNTANANPFLTTSQGHFSFGLLPNQLGTLTQPTTYFVNVSAPGFRSRLLQITLSPDGKGLFKMLVHSLDGMAIAIADGFELSESEVEVKSIADVAFNIPMFETSTLEVTKTADRPQVEVGDVVTYRIETHNASVAPLYDTVITDILPNSFNYAANTAMITRNGSTQPAEPQVMGNVMKFNLGEMKAGERISIVYRVRVGVNAANGDNFNSAVGNGHFPTGELVQTPPARVAVRVGGGVFSMKQFIIGRVFIDDNGNQSFDKGEKPVVGARLYLSNGESVITDSEGMYNIPAVTEGAQVISIDPITLPDGYLLADSHSRSGKDWSRLLRTPLGGGAMLRQNFVLVASKVNPPIAGSKMPDDDAKNTPKVEKTEDKQLSTKDILADMKDVQNVEVEYTKENSPKAGTETTKPVAAGEVLINSLSNNQVVMSPAFNLEVSVAQNWKAKVELNGQPISDNNIGQTREDRKNQITTYTFVGLGLKPGPNQLNVTAVSADEIGQTSSLTVYGRGATKRLEIVAEKKELQASGRDASRVFVKAFDEWGHPAQDASVMVQTSAGRLVLPEEYAKNRKDVKADKIVIGQGLTSTAGVSTEQTNEVAQQQQVNLTNGTGMVKLLSDTKIGAAHLKAELGEAKADTDVQFVSELRPSMLTSLAEVTVGKNAPEMQNHGVDENFRAHVQLFYRGQLFSSQNMLTLAYDSQQSLNRLSGRDRVFQMNTPDRVYPIFGDSSTRFQETESNSKVYARLDRGRSYAMFGDFTADMENSRLVGYGRKLTGVKIHLENSNGDFVTATGARPDTSFARQIIPGGSLGIVQLAYPDILTGSESLVIETRDRRNPEVILSRETLTRGLDYNMDTATGTIFFLRPISTFDRELNLIQVVATYEYHSNGFESAVYTGRASKNFNSLGLRLGMSYIDQRQTNAAPFRLGGLDATLNLPNHGKLQAEWAISHGSLNNNFSFVGNSPNGNQYNGNAFFVSVEQPIPVWQSVLRFEGSTATKNFFNPFGATVTPGSTRGAFSWEMKPVNKSSLKFDFVEEANKTDNVDNNRVTAGVTWTQTINEKIRVSAGYDFRHFTDSKDDKTVTSNLITVGAEYKPTEKLDFSIKREQNIGDADPSYPNQTTLAANYRVSDWAKIFFTQRFSANAITPIADVAQTGFAVSNARNETAIGVETKWGKYTSMSGRYQLENGINGTDSFAVAGLQNRLPINKQISVDLGFEHAFHLAGNGQSYNNFLAGINYLPNDKFRSSFRYELRDRDGLGQVLSFAAAGEFRPGWTALGRFQYGNINYNNRQNLSTDGQAAMAIRPHDTDKYGLLFSYTHRSSFFSGTKAGELPTQLKSDVLSVDGFHQTTKRLELYGRFALKMSGDGNTALPYASNLTYLVQGRAQYRISRLFDIAAEDRYLYQPSSGSQKQWFGAELGFWATPDLRIGGGYNFSRSQEPYGFNSNNVFNRSGFYFVISSKISRLFNLFGTKKDGLQYYEDDNNKLQKTVSPTPADK